MIIIDIDFFSEYLGNNSVSADLVSSTLYSNNSHVSMIIYIIYYYNNA